MWLFKENREFEKQNAKIIRNWCQGKYIEEYFFQAQRERETESEIQIIKAERERKRQTENEKGGGRKKKKSKNKIFFPLVKSDCLYLV